MSVLKLKEKSEWYKKVIAEIKRLKEQEKNHNLAIIRVRHRMGELIDEVRERAELEYGGMTVFMEKVADQVGYSRGELYNSWKFHRKYPDLSTFLVQFSATAEKLSWHYIAHGLLFKDSGGRRDGEQKEPWICSLCEGEYAEETKKEVGLCPYCFAEFQLWREEKKQ